MTSRIALPLSGHAALCWASTSFLQHIKASCWMAGTSPAMTSRNARHLNVDVQRRQRPEGDSFRLLTPAGARPAYRVTKAYPLPVHPGQQADGGSDLSASGPVRPASCLRVRNL